MKWKDNSPKFKFNYFFNMSLTGRLAFVTGGGSGIGKATSELLAKQGASVIVTDVNYKAVEQTVGNIPQNHNQRHLGLFLDVGSSNSIHNALKETITKFAKPPTIIVNAAGITRDNFLLKLSEQDFDQVIDINLKGTFLVIQTFAKSIIEHGLNNASIINIASVSGKYGNIGQTNYNASKAGVELLTKTAAKELGKLGFRINAIVPGMILTPMLEAVPDKIKEKFLTMIPLGRLGKPEEVAEVIAFLASDKSSYISGASIEITGGY